MDTFKPNYIKISYNDINRLANLPTDSKKFCNYMIETAKIKKVFRIPYASWQRLSPDKNKHII